MVRDLDPSRESRLGPRPAAHQSPARVRALGAVVDLDQGPVAALEGRSGATADPAPGAGARGACSAPDHGVAANLVAAWLRDDAGDTAYPVPLRRPGHLGVPGLDPRIVSEAVASARVQLLYGTPAGEGAASTRPAGASMARRVGPCIGVDGHHVDARRHPALEVPTKRSQGGLTAPHRRALGIP